MSVNGRPFKPDPTSYQMTGIPCGNPARYKSRGVIRMTRSSIPYENQQVGIPGQGTVSEAETELQNLIKNQFNSSAAYAKKTLNFTTPGRGGEMMVPSARGFLTLSEFQKVSEGDKESNQMRGLGFTDHQINHLLVQKGLIDEDLNALRKRKAGNIVPHPDFVKHGIQEMMEAKELKEAELEAEHDFEPMKKISRHMAQLESAILQHKKHPLADMYRKKAQGLKGETAPSDNFSSTFLEVVDIPATDNSNKGRKKKRFFPEEELAVNNNDTDDRNDDQNNDTNSSKYIDKYAPTPKQPIAEEKLAPVPPKPVVLTSKIDSIEADAIAANKALAEDITKQFPNYDRGTPSKVLYLKNLDKQIAIQDLVSLFIRFQEEGKDKISFKLMDGKMKGQAFVTFHDEPTATSALELAHGYILKSKPVIIQYGKAK